MNLTGYHEAHILIGESTDVSVPVSMSTCYCALCSAVHHASRVCVCVVSGVIAPGAARSLAPVKKCNLARVENDKQDGPISSAV